MLIAEPVFEGFESGSVGVVDGEGGEEFVLNVERLLGSGGTNGVGIEGMVETDGAKSR